MLSLNKLQNLHGFSQKTLASIKTHAGQSAIIKRVSGGLIHYVYRVVGKRGTVYLKIRTNHFTEVPQIKTEARFINDEVKALKIYYSYFPEIFPQILNFDKKDYCLVLSDVMPGQETLENALNNQTVRSKDIHFLGVTIGKIHSATSHINASIRKRGDEPFRERQLFYLLESADHPVLVKIVKKYKKRPTNLILGDPSPKNIGIKNSKIGICDLENSRQCSYIFELGHIIAHLLIHNLQDKKRAKNFIELFLDGYKMYMPNVNFTDPLLGPTVLGILLYRLNNPLIPYNLNIDKKERLGFEAKVRCLLESKNLTIQEIINLIK